MKLTRKLVIKWLLIIKLLFIPLLLGYLYTVVSLFSGHGPVMVRLFHAFGDYLKRRI